jgi:phospholipase/lecithinase/hemolysin
MIKCEVWKSAMKRIQHRENAARAREALALLHKVALAVTMTFGVMSPEVAFGAPFKTNVVAFGDSLLDAGTYLPIAEAFFGGGRFTTNPGLNFTQDVARSYGSVLTPAFIGGFGVPLLPAGGLDYAQGGSRVTSQPGTDHAPGQSPFAAFEQQTTIPVKDQVAEFLKAHRQFDPDQLILINGGANDILFQLTVAQAKGTASAQQDARNAIIQSANDLVGVVATMVSKGATHVVLINVPDIGKAPIGVASADNGQSFTQISQLFNATLASALQQQNFGRKVLLIDAFSFVDHVISDFQQYGFTVSNTAIACNLSAQVAIATEFHLDNPSVFGSSLFCSPRTYVSNGADQNYMFADELHPTTRLNAVVAQYVENQIAAQHWK